MSAHIINPGTYDYVTLHDNWDFIDMIKLRILRWKRYPLLAKGIITRVLVSERRQESQGQI